MAGPKNQPVNASHAIVAVIHFPHRPRVRTAAGLVDHRRRYAAEVQAQDNLMKYTFKKFDLEAK